MNLYTISNEYQMLLDKEELDEADLLRLNTVDKDMREKAIAIAAYILNKKAEYIAMNDAINKMDHRACGLLKKIEYLTDYLKKELEACQLNKIDDHPEFEISLRMNAPSVWIEHEELIPEEFIVRKETRSISKTLIKQAIKDGKIVPGASLHKETSLQIK